MLIPRTLDLDLAGGTTGQPDISLAAGSLGEIAGAGFVYESTTATETPLPTQLGGVSVTIGRYEAPLLAVHPNLVRFQTPWGFATDGNRELRLPVEITGAAPLSPFVPPPPVARVREDWPRPLFGPDAEGPPLTLAANQNFSALITRANPAAPGDIVHFYLTGLGAVENEPPTGHAAPTVPPLPATRDPVVCGSAGHGWLVLYAGLAPGLVGVYQLTLQIPSDPPFTPDGTTGTACFTSRLNWAQVNVPVRTAAVPAGP